MRDLPRAGRENQENILRRTDVDQESSCHRRFVKVNVTERATVARFASPLLLDFMANLK